ncbi:ribosome-associated heat shock protein Hsp15 [Aliidiomarina halalkaliphila]|uniref:Heat shock protein 15 n=1 Tax=Aliidiomarina halalkaliphila TaxID=2593535 RepID=A0A552X5M3_9GAMM|nr:ribosome-associated heat shock protein Hsp15 [Aliidiomarina halalkaliphila]TRW50318.1 ribosome-associated heat shock protein Hsp15 [Aliidiomarina halalkaliphila]
MSNVSVRLDKWLWAARFFKTRALARSAIQAGKVHYNGQRSKPAKIVEVGALLTIPRGYDRYEVVIDTISDQRRGAAEAQTLYTETEQSVAKREENARARKLNQMYNPHPDQRPDKKQRRDLIKFKQQ